MQTSWNIILIIALYSCQLQPIKKKTKNRDVPRQKAKTSSCQAGTPREAALCNNTQVSTATSNSSFPAQHLTLGSLAQQRDENHSSLTSSNSMLPQLPEIQAGHGNGDTIQAY